MGARVLPKVHARPLTRTRPAQAARFSPSAKTAKPITSGMKIKVRLRSSLVASHSRAPFLKLW
jgi:hypothetical protein